VSSAPDHKLFLPFKRRRMMLIGVMFCHAASILGLPPNLEAVSHTSREQVRNDYEVFSKCEYSATFSVDFFTFFHREPGQRYGGGVELLPSKPHSSGTLYFACSGADQVLKVRPELIAQEHVHAAFSREATYYGSASNITIVTADGKAANTITNLKTSDARPLEFFVIWPTDFYKYVFADAAWLVPPKLSTAPATAVDAKPTTKIIDNEEGIVGGQETDFSEQSELIIPQLKEAGKVYQRARVMRFAEEFGWRPRSVTFVQNGRLHQRYEFVWKQYAVRGQQVWFPIEISRKAYDYTVKGNEDKPVLARVESVKVNPATVRLGDQVTADLSPVIPRGAKIAKLAMRPPVLHPSEKDIPGHRPTSAPTSQPEGSQRGVSILSGEWNPLLAASTGTMFLLIGVAMYRRRAAERKGE